jgi:hypothetical protein
MIEAFVVDHDTGGGLFDSEGIAALKAVGGSLRTKAAVDTVRLPQALAEFIGSPLSATAKALYGSAMGFLQRRAPLEDCEAGMKLALDAFVGSLNRSVYETWLTFALIDRLGPTEFRAVSYTESGELLARPTTSLEIGFQVPLKDYRLPEALFRTASGACFAYKFECSNEIAYYKNPDKCRDLTAAGNTAGLLCHRTLLLYQVDGLETVPVLACRSNHYTVTPALLVEHLSWDELRSPQALAQARKRPLVFGPKTKLAIAVRADAAQGALTDVTIPDRLPDNLEAFAASYDGRVLDAVLGLL